MGADTEEFLSHYGIKGMRWGVVKKDDTSSGSSSKSAAQKSRAETKTAKQETKAKKFDAKAKGIQDKINALDKQPAPTPYRKKLIRMEKQELEQDKATAVKAAKDTRDGKMTDRQKKALKGAAIVGGIVAVGVTYSMLQSGEGRRLVTKGAMFVRGQDKLFPFKTKPKLMRDMDVDGIMKDIVPQINSDYGGIGTKMNCRRCTMAYELRRRGYDVAATRTTNAHGQTLFGLETALDPSAPVPRATGKYATTVKSILRLKEDPGWRADLANGAAWGKNLIDNPNKDTGLFQALQKQPNGSRGEVGIQWGFGGGHSLAYEIVQGKPVIFDTQSGKVFKNVNELRAEFAKIGGIADAAFTRLDDVPMNSDFLMRWVKNA